MTGFVVVVVGAVVVVVVVLEVVVVAFVSPLPDENSGSVVLVVVVLDDVDVLPEGCPAVVLEDWLCVVLAPGCSVATTRPRATVAPVAPRIAPRVRRRSRTPAFALVSC